MGLILVIIFYILQAYYYMMIAYVLMGWIPELRRTRIYATLKNITDPYLRLFRGLIVIGMFDFTPIIGFILYSIGLNYYGEAIPIIAGLF